ncbi:MAG: NAD-dependent epimerase/dehydratase family protein, partial [Firmicutes bacterium]|nr:NAD-dependent epimerase/dehydratase family protein [Bacillota bacterium]
MSILVTGASGFIGSKVCEMLVKSGKDVVAIDNMNDYYDVKIKNYKLK